MGFMESLGNMFSEEKREGRKNDGGKFMAVPEASPGEMTEEEEKMTEKRRKKVEELEELIREIEGNPDHIQYSELENLKEELRQILEPK